MTILTHCNEDPMFLITVVIYWLIDVVDQIHTTSTGLGMHICASVLRGT
jgi:hypothetical protein